MEEEAAMPLSGRGAFQKEGTARARLSLAATCGLSQCPSSPCLPDVLSSVSPLQLQLNPVM